MAKKTSKTSKQAENAIKRNAPAEAKWLTQPINITFMKGDMTLNQVNTMIEVVDALQGRITYALANHTKSVFEDKDYDAQGKVVVAVPFNSMTDDPRRYQYYESVARSLAETTVTVEKIGDDGTPYKSIKPIINEARVPKSESGYREGNIEFVIEKDMIETLFDINRYNRYIKSVAKNSKSVYTSRIYQFITAYKKLGEWRPKYEDLHIMFGFSEYKTSKDTKEREWVPNKYPNYRQFKQKILKVAHDELKDLADRGEVDCYFEFNEEYPTAKQMGKPERIRFKIITTKYGSEHEKSVELSRTQIQIEDLLKEFGCTASDVKQVMALVDADNASYCVEKLKGIKAYVEEHKDKIENVKKYVVSSVKNALLELMPNAEEVVAPQPSCDEQNKAEEKVEDYVLSDEDREKWSRVVDALKGSSIIDALQFKTDAEGAYVEVPHNLAFDVFGKEIGVIEKMGLKVRRGE